MPNGTVVSDRWHWTYLLTWRANSVTLLTNGPCWLRQYASNSSWLTPAFLVAQMINLIMTCLSDGVLIHSSLSDRIFLPDANPARGSAHGNWDVTVFPWLIPKTAIDYRAGELDRV